MLQRYSMLFLKSRRILLTVAQSIVLVDKKMPPPTIQVPFESSCREEFNHTKHSLVGERRILHAVSKALTSVADQKDSFKLKSGRNKKIKVDIFQNPRKGDQC